MAAIVELRYGQKISEHAEHIASRVGGSLLFALAIYVTIAALWRLWTGTGEVFSWLGPYRRADRDPDYALFGPPSDRHCREDWESCAPR